MVLLLLALGSCASAPTDNVPLPQGEMNSGYDIVPMNRQSGRDDLIVLVSFSGGGKRSAAFAHGALRGMRHMPVPGAGSETSTLLEEIDQIASVSGGTFPAAHYALHRERSFDTFPTDFLNRDIEAHIWGTFLLPWNWSWLFSPSYGTNDRMADLYDRLMFRGATFAELVRLGRRRLAIGATELATGISFAFVPQPFDLICSELARFPLARAVAASNGFPILFTPITLENHRGRTCTSPMPPFPDPQSVRADSRQRHVDDVMRRFSDADRAPFIHLMDGGISDNLALRYILDTVGSGGERGDNYVAGMVPIRRLLWLVVDGQSATAPELSRQRVVYGVSTIINAVSGGQIDNYNFETLARARNELEGLVQRNIRWRCAQGRLVAGHLCEDVGGLLLRIALADHPNPVLRTRLLAIPTGLTIPQEDVRLLVRAGEEMLSGNRELRDFLASLERPPRRRVSASRRP